MIAMFFGKTVEVKTEASQRGEAQGRSEAYRRREFVEVELRKVWKRDGVRSSRDGAWLVCQFHIALKETGEGIQGLERLVAAEYGSATVEAEGEASDSLPYGHVRLPRCSVNVTPGA